MTLQPEPLGWRAVRLAAKRGHTTYGLAGCTQLLEAKARGWIHRKTRMGGMPKYVLTPEGEALATEQGWMK